MKRWWPAAILLLFLTSCKTRWLEQRGFAKCDEGLAMILDCKELLSLASPTPPERERLVKKLGEGRQLISEGMGLLDQAYEASGGKTSYDTTRYLEGLKVARMKIMELK